MEGGKLLCSREHVMYLRDHVTSCRCDICKQTISGRFYCCDEHYKGNKKYCGAIHYSCAHLVRHMQHPLHPEHMLFISSDVDAFKDFCIVCRCNCAGRFKYSCAQCHFLLDIKCSLLTHTKKNSENSEGHHRLGKKKIEDQQPNHPHPLILCDKDESFSYPCTCCNLPIDEDSSVVYACLTCEGLLHKSCAELPSSIEHPFHPSHRLLLLPWSTYNDEPGCRRGLRLRDEPGCRRGFWCRGCGQERNGFTYQCSDCRFDLDVHCASLKPTKNGDNQQLSLSHSHPLTLCENRENFPHPCSCCGLPLVNSIYFCGEFAFLLHKSCADLPQKIKHPLHQPHDLSFQDYRRQFGNDVRCGACLQTTKKLFFKCSECKFYLDPRCAMSKPTTMMSKFHHHPLVLSKEACSELQCDICRQSLHTPFFHCLRRDLRTHVQCIKILPTTIESYRHRHPLTLTDSPFKDRFDEDDDAEFYCAACEKPRVLKDRSYYCEACHYVAHPHCVVFEIIRVLEEEWSRTQDANKVKEPVSLTFEEFIHSFEEVEFKELKDVHVTYMKGTLNKGIRSLHLRSASNQVMTVLVSKDKSPTMPWDNWDPTSKVIKIDSYMILEKLAPTLEDLLAKYSHFSSKSNLSRKPYTFCIMVVCYAVYSMCNTDVVDVTTDVLLSWFHSFMIGKDAGFEIQFAFDRLARVVNTHFGLHASLFADPNFSGVDDEIAKQLVIVDSGDEMVHPMGISITKLDEEVEELDKKIKELCRIREEKLALVRLKKECMTDTLQLKGERAGTNLL